MNTRMDFPQGPDGLMGLVLMLAWFWLAGCGKNAEVETDPATTVGPAGRPRPFRPPPVPEDKTEVEDVAMDYASIEPSEYGVMDVYFAFDQYDLDNEAMGTLSRNAKILNEAGVTVLISGHCDERGTVEYNLALGEKRANAVRDYLVSLGVPGRQADASPATAKSKPFAYGSNEDAWAQNRRAHFERP